MTSGILSPYKSVCNKHVTKQCPIKQNDVSIHLELDCFPPMNPIFLFFLVQFPSLPTLREASGSSGFISQLLNLSLFCLVHLIRQLYLQDHDITHGTDQSVSCKLRIQLPCKIIIQRQTNGSSSHLPSIILKLFPVSIDGFSDGSV